MFFSIKLFFKALLTVVISVCSTDNGRVLASLSSSCHVVRAGTDRSRGGKPREGLEIKPQLTNIIRYLWDDFNKKIRPPLHLYHYFRTIFFLFKSFLRYGEGARTSGARGVGAGIVWISDVGGVGLDAGAAGRGGDHT